MSEETHDQIGLGQAEIPSVLYDLAESLPFTEEEQLESQLQNFDTFLGIMSEAARPQVAAMLRRAAGQAAEASVAGRILQAAVAVAAGGRAAAPYDHAEAMRAYRAEHRRNFPGQNRDASDAALLAKIDKALEQISAQARAGLDPALSIERQLNWCRALVLDEEREPMPGPFSMGMIAVREFDHWGNEPELAQLINEIERLANAKLAAAK